jgi:hypothetical protein
MKPSSIFQNETSTLPDRPQHLRSKAPRFTHRLLAVDNPRILYLSIPKCGCTFVKNVLWYLNFESYHPNPIRVHDDDDKIPRASDFYQDANFIRNEAMAFTIVRNPVDRFLSLYFDKIIGSGRTLYVPLAKILIERHGLIERPTTISEHHYNLEIASSWIKRNLIDRAELPSEAHWTPQSSRINIMREFDLTIITVDNLKKGLVQLLQDRVPDIEEIASRAERNQSPRQFSKRELLTDQVRKRINEVYSQDRKLYRAAARAWEQYGGEGMSEFDLPRFGRLFPMEHATGPSGN